MLFAYQPVRHFSRRARGAGGLLLAALFMLPCLTTPAHGGNADGINFDKPLKKWYQGPVRYIISKQEVKAYKSLETEVERATFIDWFWQRRDIIPATPENEFQARFERRVLEATRKFSHTSKPGWKTDMGKIYILVGPPEEINTDVMARTHRGIITWIYRRPPFPDLEPNTVIAFARDATGEFNISTSPTIDSDVARGLQFAKIKRTAEDRYIIPGTDPVLLNQGVSVNQSELQTMMIYGRMMQLPPREEELFQAFVQTRETYGAIPADSRLDFYKSVDSNTFATITVAIKSSAVQYRTHKGKELPDVGVFGKLVSRTETDLIYPLAGDSNFAASLENEKAGPDDLLIFQAIGGFKPGTYDLVLGVEDRVTRKIAAYRNTVAVPDLTTDALSLSSITLAGTLEPTDYIHSTAKPFHLGKFRIVPQPGNTFRQSGELNIYFQIYNAAIDKATGQPRLDVRYLFKVLVPGGEEEIMGAYELKNSRAQVQGYAVPLKDWPPGNYQVVAMVHDKVAETMIQSDDISFNVIE